MDTRLLKMVNKKVRIVKNKEHFDVEARTYLGLFPGWSKWESLNTYSTLKNAIKKKNMHIVLIVMRDMDCRCEFINRRTTRRKLKLGY